jgi:hypothetical protein
MKRQALIITNPGNPEDKDDYCAGVERDAANYRRFLLSPAGGAWEEAELAHLRKPDIFAVQRAVGKLTSSGCEYALVIFSGLGSFSKRLNSTILHLREGHSIDSSELRLRGVGQTLIIDSCRKVPAERPLLSEAAPDLLKSMAGLSRAECRRCYDAEIAKCGRELIVMRSCSNGEYSYDSPVGGYYSSSLMEAATGWAVNVREGPDTGMRCRALSVVAAHALATPLVRSKSGERQTPPEPDKPRSGSYFPFCVVA